MTPIDEASFVATDPDIRFDCRYCSKPITVAAKYAGHRVKCLSCKNPVVVPGVGGGAADASRMDETVGATDQTQLMVDPTQRTAGQTQRTAAPTQRTAPPTKRTAAQTQRLEGRVVRARRRFPVWPLIKLAAVIGLAYGAWIGADWWQSQERKALGTLLTEMADGTLANEAVIRRKIRDQVNEDQKLTDERVSVLGSFNTSPSEDVRKVVAEMLGMSANAKAIAFLQPMIERDKVPDIRREAALALGEVGWVAKDKRVIEWLIARLGVENDRAVVGGLHGALRVMTANTDQNRPTREAWKFWWEGKGKAFEFGPKGTR